MLPSIRFFNAKPPHALTSREVNLISNAAKVSHVCAMTSSYLIAAKQISLMDFLAYTICLVSANGLSGFKVS